MTVGQNQVEMRNLSIEIMQANYRSADVAANAGDLERARELLEDAERWRIRARSHGAKV